MEFEGEGGGFGRWFWWVGGVDTGFSELFFYFGFYVGIWGVFKGGEDGREDRVMVLVFVFI